MNSDTKKERMACIDDFIIDEILATSDAEILAEVDAPEIDKAIAGFERAQLVANKQRFAAVQAAVRNDRAGQVLSFDRGKAQEELKRILESDTSLRGKLTLAARKGTGANEDDAEGILDDLAELASESDRATDDDR